MSASSRPLLAGILLLAATPAWAAERDYCPARPGLGTPACTIAPGRISVETALADWTRGEDAGGEDSGGEDSGGRTDTVVIGDTLVRIGLTDTLEAQVGWTPFGHVRTRDGISGAVDRADGTGDALLGFKANLRHPDGGGFSIAMQPFVTLPVGRGAIGAGDWGAGIVVPVSVDLNSVFNLQFSPEVDAAVDQVGHGRHFATSDTVGLGMTISDTVSDTVEIQITRDDDPSGATTQALASLSLAWMPAKNMQFDVGAVAGLNRAAPGVELYLGISREF